MSCICTTYQLHRQSLLVEATSLWFNSWLNQFTKPANTCFSIPPGGVARVPKENLLFEPSTKSTQGWENLGQKGGYAIAAAWGKPLIDTNTAKGFRWHFCCWKNANLHSTGMYYASPNKGLCLPLDRMYLWGLNWRRPDMSPTFTSPRGIWHPRLSRLDSNSLGGGLRNAKETNGKKKLSNQRIYGLWHMDRIVFSANCAFEQYA